MTDEELLDVFGRILGDLLSDGAVVLTMQTQRQDVPNWDSFAYVNFIVAAELELGIKFKVADIESFDNVGAIVAKARELLR